MPRRCCPCGRETPARITSVRKDERGEEGVIDAAHSAMAAGLDAFFSLGARYTTPYRSLN